MKTGKAATFTKSIWVKSVSDGVFLAIEELILLIIHVLYNIIQNTAVLSDPRKIPQEHTDGQATDNYIEKMEIQVG